MPLPWSDNSLQIRAREGGASGVCHTCSEISPVGPCIGAGEPHMMINKEICLHADHGCTGRCVEASQEGRCEFRPAFFFVCFFVQWPDLSRTEPGAADGPRVLLPAATIRQPFRNRPRTQPILNPRRFPVSLASCCKRPSSRSPTKASEDLGTLSTMSTSPSDATAGTNSSWGTMPGIDAENR